MKKSAADKLSRDSQTGLNALFYEMKKNRILYLMMLPTIIFLLVNNYLPMLGISLAFLNFKPALGVFGSRFVGLKNFEFFFSTPDFFRITRNTILYNAVYIVLDITVAAFFAIVLNELFNKKLKKLYQSVMIMPFFLSWVVVNYIFFSFLSVDRGFINATVMDWLNLTTDYNWYQEKAPWPFILVFAQLWRYTGYNTIMLYSGLMGIDNSYYEAAFTDGATKWQQIRKITIPLLSPIMIVLFLMLVGRIFFADFGLHYQVTNNSSALYPVTDVLDTYTFRSLRQMGNISMAAAAGFYQAVVGLFIVLAANKLVKQFDPEKSLF